MLKGAVNFCLLFSFLLLFLETRGILVCIVGVLFFSFLLSCAVGYLTVGKDERKRENKSEEEEERERRCCMSI